MKLGSGERPTLEVQPIAAGSLFARDLLSSGRLPHSIRAERPSLGLR